MVGGGTPTKAKNSSSGKVEKKEKFCLYDDLTSNAAFSWSHAPIMEDTFIEINENFKMLKNKITFQHQDEYINDCNKWLMDIINNLNSKPLLMIADKEYDRFLHYTMSNTSLYFSSSIGLFCTYEKINIPPILTIFVHEMNVFSDNKFALRMPDTHISEDTTISYAKHLIDGNTIIPTKLDDKFLSLDVLYQSNALVSLIDLLIILDYE